MQLAIVYSKQFKKDIKKIQKQNKSLQLILSIVDILVNHQPLPKKYKNHKLIGNYSGYQELHIQPDWLLIYKITHDTLYIARTGSHSELF